MAKHDPALYVVLFTADDEITPELAERERARMQNEHPDEWRALWQGLADEAERKRVAAALEAERAA